MYNTHLILYSLLNKIINFITSNRTYGRTKYSFKFLLSIIRKFYIFQIIEKSLQPYVAKITMTSSILSNVWPGILVLFVGPWSDKFGRRPVLLVTFTGTYKKKKNLVILEKVYIFNHLI